jgi:hypothetical protein
MVLSLAFEYQYPEIFLKERPLPNTCCWVVLRLDVGLGTGSSGTVEDSGGALALHLRFEFHPTST